MATPTRNLSQLSRKLPFRLGTLNIQGGIQTAQDSDMLLNDLQKYELDVVCLQETRYGAFNQRSEKGIIICLETEPETPIHQQYGQGFYVTNQWMSHLHSTRRVSNRISVIQLLVGNTSHCRLFF